jgi:hypothetical protein
MMANLLQAQATAEDDEEVIELSPFVLDGSSDMGYYSSQTLAGGRMKSDLKDVATSVQVVTAEMIQDIGATSLEEILVYTTNTDVAGSMSNYTAADAAGDGTLSSEVARQDPGNANRVRGLGSATRTANYYETSIPFDSYNSGRIDINRGANSFLFGLGSPGGIINSNPAQADFRNSTSIDFHVSTENFENNTSLRGSFNVNRVLIDDKLAVRIAVMDGTDEYTQRPAMRETSRRYIAAKFKPFADKQILLRANYESGDIFSVPVDRIAPLETLSTFINDPYGTVFDTPSGRWSHDPFNNITDNNQGVGYLGVDAAGNAVSVANYNKQIKPNGWAIVWDDSLNADGLPTRATHTGWTNARIRRKNPYFDPNNNLTGNTESGMVRGLRLTDIGGDYQGFNRQGLVDYEIYDFRTNLLTGPLDYYSNDFDRVNVTLEAVSKRGDFGIELGYNREEWIRDSYVGVGTPEISIDNNYTFAQGPNELFGDVNPNYGKLYITGTAANNSLNKDIRETKRATAFAKLDFTEKFENSPLKWLGRHTVTGLYDHNVLDQEQFANRQFIFGNDAGFHLVQANATQYQRQVASLYYISDAHPAAFTDSSFQVSDFRVTGLPSNLSETYPAGYEIPVSFLSMGDAANDLRWNSPVGDERPSVGAFTPEWQPTTGSLIETTVESFALNMQSFLINDLLVANLGWREDTVQLIRNANPPRTDEFVPILDSEGFNLDGIEGDTITENVFSYGLVAKVPNRWLPEGTSLSFHYGDSSNFIPNPGGFDWNGDPVPSSSGSTRELGVTVGLMNNKLVARLNAYKGKVANEPFGGVDDAYKFMSTAYVLRGYQTLFQDQDVYDRDRDGVFDLDLDDDGNLYDPDLDNNGFLDRLEVGGADYVAGDTYMSLADFLIVEQAYSDLVNPWVRETGGLELISGADTADGEPQVTSGNGLWFTLGDTVDLTAEGVEFELTFNPTRNLRLSANVTQQESRQDNVAPRLTELWDQLIAISQATPSAQFVTQGGNKLSTPLRTEAYASNTLQGVWVNSERVGQAYLAARALAGSDNPEVREYRVNLLGNYTFSEGRFKGMNIGGAFRYQDQAAAGYPVITDPVSGFAVKDVFNPHLDETTEYVDFWIGYKRKIFNDKMNWRIQLNIRNLFADKDPLAIQFQPDGSIARVSIPVPRQFSLSNTFSF